MLDDVPPWPCYELRQLDDGSVTVTGPAASHGPWRTREDALAEVGRQAKRAGRPVRADAVDADGTWPLLVDTEGGIHERHDRPLRNARHTPPPPNGPGEPAGASPQLDLAVLRDTVADALLRGDVETAVRLAGDAELHLLQRHGMHARTLRAREIRAHALTQTGTRGVHTAVLLYCDTAGDWLTLRRRSDAGHAADAAHALWQNHLPPAEARELADTIVALRARLPGPRGRPLRAAQSHRRGLLAS